jgi:hypothetical protein
MLAAYLVCVLVRIVDSARPRPVPESVPIQIPTRRELLKRDQSVDGLGRKASLLLRHYVNQSNSLLHAPQSAL